MKNFFKAAAIAFFCISSFGCAKRETPADAGAKNGTLLVGNSADPATLDPSLTTGLNEFKILCALFEGLVCADTKTLEILPAAAESWSFDGSSYTFKIRKSAKWSDGEKLKASDFVFAFKRILNPKVGAEYAHFLFPIKNAKSFFEGKTKDLGAKAIDGDTLKIELERPCPHFLSLLYHNAFFPLPEHILKKFGAEDKREGSWVRPENMVSNGAFTLKKWSVNGKVRVEKNPLYWDAENVLLNAVEFYPISNINTEDRAFRAGQLHITDSVAASRMDAIKRDMAKNLKIGDMLGVYYYAINTARPPLNDPGVRKALAMSINRKAIISNFLKAEQKPATTFVPPNASKGYACPISIKEDIKEARKLLADAGYPDGKGFPEITITYNTSEQHRPIAEAIQAQWKEALNIKVELFNLSWPAYLAARRQGDFFITRASWVADYASPESFLEMFSSKSPLNHSGWKNKNFDNLTASAMTNDAKVSNEKFSLAEKLIIEEAPIIPIYFYSRVLLMDERVKNWHLNPLDYHNFKGVHFEEESEND